MSDPGAALRRFALDGRPLTKRAAEQEARRRLSELEGYVSHLAGAALAGELLLGEGLAVERSGAGAGSAQE